MAGLVSLGVVAFLLFLVQPAPFDSRSILLFAVLAGVCCPLGQILASGLLPRGNAWAPALRRLDSYLLAAPIWLLLGLVGDGRGTVGHRRHLGVGPSVALGGARRSATTPDR